MQRYSKAIQLLVTNSLPLLIAEPLTN